MSLGLSTYHTGGAFSPRFEFNCKSGRFFKVDRTADGSDIIRLDLTMQPPPVAFDIGSIEVGWINFQTGASPTFLVVPFGQPMPERPDRNHKAGFRSKMWDGRANTVAREFSATAGATVNAIEDLWEYLTVMPEAAAGMVPVLRLVDVEPIHSQRGTNYAPTFKLIQWIARDEAVFGPRTVAAPGSVPILAVVPPSFPTATAFPTALPAPTPAPAVAAWPSTTTTTPAAIPAAWPTPSAKAA